MSRAAPQGGRMRDFEARHRLRACAVYHSWALKDVRPGNLIQHSWLLTAEGDPSMLPSCDAATSYSQRFMTEGLAG